MNTRPLALAFLAVAAFAAHAKADYLFTYKDTAGDVVGFTETSPQAAGQITNFLFDVNSVSGFVFNGNVPSECLGLASLQTGCTALQNKTGFDRALFPGGSFTTPGTFAGTNGAQVSILQYTGFLFTYQDVNGNVLAFSEPTLQISGTTNQFLFATAGVTNFTFNGAAPSACGIIAARDLGCTGVTGTPVLPFESFFTAGSFLAPGTYNGDGATVNIVQATATPEPAPLAAVALVLIGIGLLRRK